jgi:hypothetical protein
VVSDTNQLEDPEDEEDLNDWMNLPIETDEDDIPTYIPDENQEYTGENASYMSLQVSPDEIEQAELDIINNEADNSANFDDLIFNIEEDNGNNEPDFF